MARAPAFGEAPVNQAEPVDPGRALIHDFRNLLAVIVNYCELIEQETDDATAVIADVKEIKVAAERAIAMTGRLPGAGHPAPGVAGTPDPA